MLASLPQVGQGDDELSEYESREADDSEDLRLRQKEEAGTASDEICAQHLADDRVRVKLLTAEAVDQVELHQ